jgi:heme/copper-type cytochrome/quinol oxidase subunit 4
MQLLNPNVIIPIILGLHVLGIILTYIITFYYVRKKTFPESLSDLIVLGGLLGIIGGMIFFIYYIILIKKEQKKYNIL